MPLSFAITGSTGLVGSRLIPYLLSKGHKVTQVSRQKAPAQSNTSWIFWDPKKGILDPRLMEGFDVVIHLAGANVGQAWSESYKLEILESRLHSTRLLMNVLKQVQDKPKLLISASAIGFYGNHPSDKQLYEQSPAGQGFLADVCRRWEEETLPAADLGMRLVHLRIGVVLSKSGGALAKMWIPFQMGIGGVLGHGGQMMSWVAVDEIPSIIDFIVNHPQMNGAVNVVGPQAVTNREFTRTLGRVIRRPVFFPVPAFMIRFLFGEMGQTLLLEGNHVVPKKLLDAGYVFQYPDLQSALEKAVS